MRYTLHSTWQLLRYLGQRVLHDRLLDRAGALAYTTVLAIVPLMMAIVMVLSYFPLFAGLTKSAEQLILNNFVEGSAKHLSLLLAEFLKHAKHLSAENLLLLLSINVFMLYSIHESFNDIWQVNTPWHFSIAFVIYILVLMLSPLFLGGLLLMGNFIIQLSLIKAWFGRNTLSTLIFLSQNYAIHLIVFTLINWVLPSCHLKFRYALAGGLITTLMYQLAKNLFAFYLMHFHTYRQLYGALASFPLFLIWLYVSWLIILFGAVVTHYCAKGPVPMRRTCEK